MFEKGCKVSYRDVKNLMLFFKYKRRTLLKTKAMGEVKERNEQFEKIAKLKDSFLANGFPVFSLDSKKNAHVYQVMKSVKYENIVKMRKYLF